jgi:hypothetical protein
MESYTKQSSGYYKIKRCANNVNGRGHKGTRCDRRVDIDSGKAHGHQRSDQSRQSRLILSTKILLRSVFIFTKVAKNTRQKMAFALKRCS